MFTLTLCGLEKTQNKLKLEQTIFVVLKSSKIHAVQSFHPRKKNSSKKLLKAPNYHYIGAQDETSTSNYNSKKHYLDSINDPYTW